MKILICVLSLLLAGTACADVFDLHAITIEATRSGDLLGDTTRNVSLITGDAIAAAPSKSLPEILGTQTGISGIQYGTIKNSMVDIRGFGETAGSNVLVLVDGRRTNQIDLSGVDWSVFDPDTIDHVEIIKGSGTVLYGDNAVGGVINVVTKKGGGTSKSPVTLSTEWGSYQTNKSSVQVEGGTKKTGFWFNYGHEETTGYRANSNYWANNFNSRLSADPTDQFGIDFGQGYHKDRYQLPGALFGSNIDQFGREGVRPARNYDHGWTTDYNFNLTPRFKFNAGISEGEFSMFGSQRKKFSKLFTDSSYYETAFQTNSYEVQPKLVVSTPVSDTVTNKLTGGYDYFYAREDRRSGFPTNPSLGYGFPADITAITKDTQGIYLLDEVEIDGRWLLNAGARGTWAEYVFDQQAALVNQSESSLSTQGYEAGLGYKYNPRSKVYANYSRSYRLPATDEFYQNLNDSFGFISGGLNANLTRQVGNQYEIGVKDETLKDVKLGAGLFYAQYQKEIYLDPATFFNTNYDGRTRRYGAEIEASVGLLDNKVEPFANLTLQESRFHGGKYGGKDIPFVPAHIAHAGITFRPLDRLSTSIISDFTGARYTISDQANTHPKVKQHATFDWTAAYGFRNVDVWVSVRNIFDKKYSTYGALSFSGDIGYYPAPERNVTVGAKVKF